MLIHFAISALIGLAPGTSHKMQGRPAIDFTLPTVGGGKVTLSQFKGKIVLLNFWATWCGPCKRELPEFERLQRKLADAGVLVLTVNVDGNVENARSFLKKNDVRLAAVWDKDKRVAAAYDVQAMPSTYIIDRRGIVRAVHKGYSPATFKRIELTASELLDES